MVRHRSLALLVIAFIVVIPEVPAQAGGMLPDIRGLSFVYPFQAVTFHAGTVPGFGDLTYPLVDPTALQTFVPIPHTFDVMADPAAPNDPSRIQVDTRFSTDFTDGPLVFPPLTLTGSYDRTTGALSVSGGATGTFLNKTGPDPFGLFPGTLLYEQVTNPMESLHGVVSVSGSGITTITGTDPVVTPGDPGNISFASANPLWIPIGSSDPNDAVFSVGVQNPTGAIYNWSASAVPEPSSIVMLIAAAGTLSLWRVIRRDARMRSARRGSLELIGGARATLGIIPSFV